MPWLPPEDWQALGLTLRLAAWTTALLLVAGTPLAWWLARTRWRGRALVEAVVALPLVLPPTVLGFYLLLALGPEGPLGRLALAFGGAPPVFRFSGLVLGSVVYSLPFVVQPLQQAFGAVRPELLEAGAVLRAGPLDRFRALVWPLARPGYLTAAVLGFAHTLGEFGVVLMIGGNIPGQTRVLSVALYDHVEALDYARAHRLAGTLLVLSFLMLAGLFALRRKPLAWTR
jgi:molybdate transport system permease protein